MVAPEARAEQAPRESLEGRDLTEDRAETVDQGPRGRLVLTELQEGMESPDGRVLQDVMGRKETLDSRAVMEGQVCRVRTVGPAQRGLLV